MNFLCFYLLIACSWCVLITSSKITFHDFSAPFPDTVKMLPLTEAKGMKKITVEQARSKGAKTTQSSDAPLYLVMTQYLIREGEQCAGEPYIVSGLAFDVCTVGLDSNGQPAGSNFFTYVSQDDMYIYFMVSQFNSSDCSGSVTEEAAIVPVFCYLLGGLNVEIKYSVSSSPTPYIGYKGLVTNNFDTFSRCEAGQPVPQWIFQPLGICYKVSSDFSYFLGGCDEKTFTVSVYSDMDCSVWKANIQQPSYVCKSEVDDHTDDDKTYYTNNYASLVCSA